MTEELFVYSDRLDYLPGDSISVRVSVTRPQPVTVSLVRATAAGQTEAIEATADTVLAVPEQSVPAHFQSTNPGSFGVIHGVRSPGGPAFALIATVWPTRPIRPGEGNQPILSWHPEAGTTLELELAEDGRLEGVLRAGDQASRAFGTLPLVERQWVRIGVGLVNGELVVVQVPLGSGDPGNVAGSTSIPVSERALAAGTGSVLIAGAELLAAPDGQPRAGRTFDGKIEAPLLTAAPTWVEAILAGESQQAFAAWSFASDFAGTGFDAVGNPQPSGQLVNAPARGMTGSNWDGQHLDFRSVPEQYGAVHFHTDDLEDAAWTETTIVTLPEDLPSGIYCVLVRGDGAEDHTPVIVGRGAHEERTEVLFLVPTFSYLAYANSRLAEELDYSSGALTDLVVTQSARDDQIYAHPEFGMSLYDHHRDGSGNCYSTALRPIPNMRWDFRSAVQNAPRHFAADIVWPAWFDSQKIPFTVSSDHALHERGESALDGAKLVITGSHPEYWSGDMLDAVERYLADGGSLAYVGGNGFYWVTSAHPQRPHLIEVRRGQQGIRTWEGEPGETTSSQSAEPGGLWRLRGRAPNRLVGVGMAAQGWDESTPGFERTAAAADPRVEWLFTGIEGPVIGDFGLVIGGAAGDEIDRADTRLGTPPHALVVATSQPHSRYYLAANEELNTPTPNINGTNNPNVRADITFFEHRGGGCVLSTSAITWTGSLAYRGFENSVSQLMRNFVEHVTSTGAAR